MFRKDNFKFGLILGLVAPVVGLVFYYFLKFFPTFSVADFFKFIFMQKSLITATLTICLVANVAVFTYYVNKRLDKTAKGIFLITFLYAFIGLIIKYFF